MKALAVAVGGSASGTTPAVAIGFSLARNLIGWTEYGGSDPLEVKATHVDTQLDARRAASRSRRPARATITAIVQATVGRGRGRRDRPSRVTAGGLWTDNKIAIDDRGRPRLVDGHLDDDRRRLGHGERHVARSPPTRGAIAVGASLAGGKARRARDRPLARAQHDRQRRRRRTSRTRRRRSTRRRRRVTVGVTQTTRRSRSSRSRSPSRSPSRRRPGVALAGGALGVDEHHPLEGQRLDRATARSARRDDPVGAVSVTADRARRRSRRSVARASPASVAFGGTTGVGVALGISVARNFIGWDPNYGAAYDYLSTDHPRRSSTGKKVKIVERRPRGRRLRVPRRATLTALRPRERRPDSNTLLLEAASASTTVTTDSTGDRHHRQAGQDRERRAGAGDVYEYIGTTALTSPDLTSLDYADYKLWKQVGVRARRGAGAGVREELEHRRRGGALTISATASRDDRRDRRRRRGRDLRRRLDRRRRQRRRRLHRRTRSRTEVKAFVQGDGDDGISAASISITADDSSGDPGDRRRRLGRRRRQRRRERRRLDRPRRSRSTRSTTTSPPTSRTRTTKVDGDGRQHHGLGDLARHGPLHPLRASAPTTSTTSPRRTRTTRTRVANEETDDPTDDQAKLIALDDAFRAAGHELQPAPAT